MKIKVGVSNHHVHLTKADYIYLFGSEFLSKRNCLSQEGEFASDVVVSLEGPTGKINDVRIVGPFRNYTQVEVLKSDTYILGVNPPVRPSGNLTDACEITISCNNKKITKKCCIIAERHLHISPEEQKKYFLYKKIYKVKIDNLKGGIIDNVHAKVKNGFSLELHIDQDDANAFLLKENDEVELIKGVFL